MLKKKSNFLFHTLTTEDGWTFSHGVTLNPPVNLLPVSSSSHQRWWHVKPQHVLYIGHVLFNVLTRSWPDGAVRPGGNMQRDGDGDGTLSTQGGHGSLRLSLIPGGFDPRAAQVGQFVELDTVLLQYRGPDWGWTCTSQRWTYLNWTKCHYKRGIKSHRRPNKHERAGRAIRERENRRGCGEGLCLSASTFKKSKQEVEQ